MIAPVKNFFSSPDNHVFISIPFRSLPSASPAIRQSPAIDEKTLNFPRKMILTPLSRDESQLAPCKSRPTPESRSGDDREGVRAYASIGRRPVARRGSMKSF